MNLSTMPASSDQLGGGDDHAWLQIGDERVAAELSFSFANLGDPVSFTEWVDPGSFTPVVLDSDVSISAPSDGNFKGATLTLVRNGGANAMDVFAATGTPGSLTPGGNLVVDSTTIGAVTTNIGDTLVLTFSTNASQALGNSAMQKIAYANISDVPPSSVQINWSFSDPGFTDATGSVTASITATNGSPANTVPPSQTASEDTDPLFFCNNPEHQDRSR